MAQQLQNVSPLQDTMEFTVKAGKVITNKTVKISVTISAIMVEGATEESLRADIRSAMSKFMTAEWQFSNTLRDTDPSGFESVRMTASSRVNETENYSLQERCKKASRKGLTISNPVVDTTVPQNMLDEAEKEIRLIIIGNVRTECEKIAAAMGCPYRIGRLAFSSLNNLNFSNNARSQTMMAMASGGASKTSYGSDGIGSDQEGLGNVSKVEISATVVLAALVGAEMPKGDTTD